MNLGFKINQKSLKKSDAKKRGSRKAFGASKKLPKGVRPTLNRQQLSEPGPWGGVGEGKSLSQGLGDLGIWD